MIPPTTPREIRYRAWGRSCVGHPCRRMPARGCLGLTAHEMYRTDRSNMHHPHARLLREGCMWAAQQNVTHACSLGGLLQRGTHQHGGHGSPNTQFSNGSGFAGVPFLDRSAMPEPGNAPSASPGHVLADPPALRTLRHHLHGPRSHYLLRSCSRPLRFRWRADLLQQQLDCRSQETC